MTGTDRADTVSIALPVYNGERFLDEALASVENQTVPADETLVFDNLSTDATAAIAKSRLSPDQVRTSDVNRGAVSNFNRAVHESTGTYFAWLASDDRLAPRFVEACLEALMSAPWAAACLPGIRYIDVEGSTLSVQVDRDLASPDAATRLRSFLRRERWAESYCLFRRERLLASPIFSDEYGADVLLVWWFLLRGALAVVDEPLLEYRVYPTKSVAEMAASLNPGAGTVQWRKLRMWARLWQLAGAQDVEAPVTRRARFELLLCWSDRSWIGHLYEDLRLASSAWSPGRNRRC